MTRSIRQRQFERPPEKRKSRSIGHLVSGKWHAFDGKHPLGTVLEPRRIVVRPSVKRASISRRGEEANGAGDPRDVNAEIRVGRGNGPSGRGQ
jgi:hypothetical protein